MKQFKSIQFQPNTWAKFGQTVFAKLAIISLSSAFPLLSWGISISLSADIGVVATSCLDGTFAQTAFCDHFCSTGEAGISGGGRRGRAHLSLTWTWQRRCLKTRWTTKCVVAYLKTTTKKQNLNRHVHEEKGEGQGGEGRGGAGRDTRTFSCSISCLHFGWMRWR